MKFGEGSAHVHHFKFKFVGGKKLENSIPEKLRLMAKKATRSVLSLKGSRVRGLAHLASHCSQALRNVTLGAS